VRIRVEAIGVNIGDAMARMGLMPEAPEPPFVPGSEIAGVIDMVGQGVPDFKEGDAVLAATRGGGYSDTLCVPWKQVFRRLDWMSAQDAAALPVNYLLAYVLLIVMGSLRKGDSVLIHNAGGATGLAAIDICRIAGAESYGTAAPDKLEFLRERGLNHPIDYVHYDYEREIRERRSGRGLQLVLDPLGGPHWKKNYRLLMPTGRVLYYGLGSVALQRSRRWWDLLRARIFTQFYTPEQLMRDNKGVMGVDLASLWDEASLMRPWMDQIIRWYDEALFRPYVDRTFSFKEAAEAHHYVQERKNLGKVLLMP
jgi:NADPH:quinone reductase-like Zn-dependent oxidoreductase